MVLLGTMWITQDLVIRTSGGVISPKEINNNNFNRNCLILEFADPNIDRLNKTD